MGNMNRDATPQEICTRAGCTKEKAVCGSDSLTPPRWHAEPAYTITGMPASFPQQKRAALRRKSIPSNVVRRSHVGLVEHVLDLEEEDRALEIVIRDVGVIVNVEIEQAIARRLQEVGVLHVERVEPYVLHEGAHAFPRSGRLIISQTCKKLVRGDARDLVSGAVEARRERAGAQLLGIVDVELVEPGIGSNQPPAR